MFIIMTAINILASILMIISWKRAKDERKEIELVYQRNKIILMHSTPAIDREGIMNPAFFDNRVMVELDE